MKLFGVISCKARAVLFLLALVLAPSAALACDDVQHHLSFGSFQLFGGVAIFLGL
jgi:hypothetical protein